MKYATVILTALFLQPAFSKTLELGVGLGSFMTNPKGLSGTPTAITVDSSTKVDAAAVLSGRALLFPAEWLGLGMNFDLTAAGSPTMSSTDSTLSSYTKYALACTSSDAMISLRLHESKVKGKDWWTNELRLVGMSSVKANCVLDYGSSNLYKTDYRNSATAKSWAAGLEAATTFFYVFHFGLEAGYRNYKSNGLVDENAQPLVDSSGKPVKVDLSAPYFLVNLGFNF